MNEHIKQLAEQAGLVRNGDFGMKRWEGPRSDSINDQDLEKFAELIVRDVLDEVLQAMDDGMDVYDTVADKFGVEE